MHTKSNDDTFSAENIALHLAFLPRIEELLGQAARKKYGSYLDDWQGTASAGRPKSIPSLLNCVDPTGKLAKHRDHVRGGITSWRRDYVKLVSQKIIEPFFREDGPRLSDELYHLHRADEAITDALSPRFHAHQAIRPPKKLFQHRTLENEFGLSDDTPIFTDNPFEFYERVIARLEAYASRNNQAKAILLSHAIVEMLSSGDERTRHIPDRDAYIGAVARIGAWTANQIGQEIWIRFFNKHLVNSAESGDRTAVFGREMLLFHRSMQSILTLNSYNEDDNYALRAMSAVDDLSPGPLGFMQELDSPICFNAATRAIFAGAGTTTIVCRRRGYTVKYLIESAMERDLLVYGRNDNMNCVLPGAHLARAYANDGQLEKASELVQSGFDLLNAAPITSQSRYAECGLNVAAGFVELQKSGTRDNRFFSKALQCAIQLGNMKRAFALYRTIQTQ